jgi:hypothetical protein
VGMMLFRCLIPWNRFFEFFEDIEKMFGYSWCIYDENVSHIRNDYLSSGSSINWLRHVEKMKLEPRMNNRSFHKCEFYQANIQLYTTKDVILFKLKWGG